MTEIGEKLGGRYTVTEYIGAGGMQDVYRVMDDILGFDLVLKTPLPGQAEKRFEQSARVAARINHHNVAKTYDYFIEDGNCYLIEEYVEGNTLEEVFSAVNFVDPHMGARIFHHLAKGLAASHHAGVVHRDMKPSNVIVTSGLDFHELKITDFGIATLAEGVFDEAAEKGDLTQSTSGTIRGALPYMAPEMMFRNKGDKLGPAMDVWSLGALMFRLLTGEYPFGVYLEAAVNVKNGNRKPWPKFMTRNPQFAVLSEQLQSIVDRCLQQSPLDRPLADELVRYCDGLCYLNSERVEGEVINLIQNGYSGFANFKGGKVFFSMESVYGQLRPDSGENKRICFSYFPGDPLPRGHPIMVMKPK